MQPNKSVEEIVKEFEERFVEKCADLEHERWSRWQKYLHSLCVKHTINSFNASTRQYEDIETGGLVIPRDRVVHWERQIVTPYSELTEKEKEYDRIEVRKYLPLIENFLRQALTSHTNTVLQGVVERVEKEKVKVYDNWATSHDRDEERFTKLTKEEKGYNKGLDLSLSLINDQIISNEEKKETWETKVGMLRQWLNEDRITDPQKMVTNEQIIKWLE